MLNNGRSSPQIRDGVEEKLRDASVTRETPACEQPPKPNANEQVSIPDGGLLAWMQVLGGFMIFFNTWGLLNTFGVFQTYYESIGLSSSSDISWIGAIQSYFVLLGGLITGRMYDNGHLRSLVVVGAFGIVFGHMMLSLCQEYWEVLLAQGFVVGLGAGCMFTPGLAVIPSYFRKRLGLAIGLCAAGSSFGGIIYPIVFYRLINDPRVGFAWSVRVLGFLALVTLIVPIAVLKQRVTPARARAIFDCTIFADLPFMMFIFGGLLGYIGLYVVFFYISYFGQATGILDESISFYIIPILNAASMFGRTAPNYLADKTGPFNMIIPGAAICGVLTFCLIAVNSLGGIMCIAVFFGFFSGVYIGMPPVLVVALTEDRTKIGTRIGMAFAIIGLGVFAGGPGTGGILAMSGGMNWTGIWLFGGVVFMASALVQTGVRVSRTGMKLMVEA